MIDAATDDVFIDDIWLPAADGYQLAATIFLPRRQRRNAVLINSAAAVPRALYRPFASYLAGRGCVVLTYDYRGIGGSRPRDLAGFDARMADWADQDAAGAVAWMRARYRTLPLCYVGHAFGGQALGLLPNNDQVARALLVAAQAACWKLIAAPERYRVLLLNAVGKPLANALGYLPGRFGLGEDLPKGVYLQWSKWVMSERYYFDDMSLVGLANYPHYRHPLMALHIEDDSWATRAAVERLCAAFTNASPDIVTVRRRDAGGGRIGHLGFFRREHRNTLWRKAADWLVAT